MGARQSKAAQEVIETAQASIRKQASRRTQSVQPRQVPSLSNADKTVHVSAQKDKIIKADAIDPDLIARMRTIGQVKVPKYATNFKPVCFSLQTTNKLTVSRAIKCWI